MKELFKVRDLVFFEEEFQDDINEYDDIIPVMQDLCDELDYEEVQCVDLNDCCSTTKMNYLIQVNGFLNEEDEFVLMQEVEQDSSIDREKLTLFVIRVYMCTGCKKWMIDILED
ncbi:MAG: hypothetical protein ACRC7N_13020 [Clostridium sp.]